MRQAGVPRRGEGGAVLGRRGGRGVGGDGVSVGAGRKARFDGAVLVDATLTGEWEDVRGYACPA